MKHLWIKSNHIQLLIPYFFSKGQLLCLYGFCLQRDHFLLLAVVTRLSAVSVIVRLCKQVVVTYLQYPLFFSPPASASHLQDVYDLQIATCPKHAHYF